MKILRIRRLSSIAMCFVPLIFALQGCAQKDDLLDVSVVPPGHAVVIAAPAGKSLGVGNTVGRSTAVPEPVVFRFRREGPAQDAPIYLDLIGTADQSARIYPAQPGVYRLVEAYHLARPGETRWSFKDSPNILEVRSGEAAYVGTLHWRDSWVGIDNDEKEARAIYQKRLSAFKSRSLKFVTRLVRSSEASQ